MVCLFKTRKRCDEAAAAAKLAARHQASVTSDINASSEFFGTVAGWLCCVERASGYEPTEDALWIPMPYVLPRAYRT